MILNHRFFHAGLVNLPNKKGRVPLTAAVARGSGKKVKVLQWLLDAGANWGAVDREQCTAFFVACTIGNLNAVRFFLHQDPSQYGVTPFDAVASLANDWDEDRHGKVSLVTFILVKKLRERDGRFALHLVYHSATFYYDLTRGRRSLPWIQFEFGELPSDTFAFLFRPLILLNLSGTRITMALFTPRRL